MITRLLTCLLAPHGSNPRPASATTFTQSQRLAPLSRPLAQGSEGRCAEVSRYFGSGRHRTGDAEDEDGSAQDCVLRYIVVVGCKYRLGSCGGSVDTPDNVI